MEVIFGKVLMSSENISKLKFQPFGMKPPVRGFENVIELAVGKKNIWVGTMQAGVAGFHIGADGKIKFDSSPVTNAINITKIRSPIILLPRFGKIMRVIFGSVP